MGATSFCRDRRVIGRPKKGGEKHDHERHDVQNDELPGTGDLATTADLVVTLLAAYFELNN